MGWQDTSRQSCMVISDSASTLTVRTKYRKICLVGFHYFFLSRFARESSFAHFAIYRTMQAPLYLPNNSELQVYIWRLTNQRQVWYEWYAESFMPVFNTPLPSKTSDDVESTTNAHGSFFASASTPMATPSPLIDAIDAQSEFEKSGSWDEFSRADIGVVKIGQTCLHNPGGRSSWIGL
jgi:type II protein arginine methyltransferase